jgi:predicted CopG family antitoxin
MHVDSSIRVSNATKEKLERLKQPDESFDDLLARLASENEPIAVGSWSDEEAEAAREAIVRSRESFER